MSRALTQITQTCRYYFVSNTECTKSVYRSINYYFQCHRKQKHKETSLINRIKHRIFVKHRIFALKCFFETVLYSETLNKQRRGATETRLEILSQLHGENKPNQVINERDANSDTIPFLNIQTIIQKERDTKCPPTIKTYERDY